MSEIQKILIPVLRKVMPSLIASQIVGVQPMNSPFLKEMLFAKYPPVITDMEIVHTALRPFMRPNEEEPNVRYRPWLEQHIGEQGVKWNWDLHPKSYSTLAVYFAEQEHATFFELTWP